jgi:hypothetical protein
MGVALPPKRLLQQHKPMRCLNAADHCLKNKNTWPKNLKTTLWETLLFPIIFSAQIVVQKQGN